MTIEYYGYNPPFFGGHQNVMSKQSGDRLIKNDVLQLLLTVPGERVMRPDWGTIIKSSLFELSDEETTDAIYSDIMAKISKYENRINVGVAIVLEDDGTVLRINVSGAFTNEPNHIFEDELLLPITRAET